MWGGKKGVRSWQTLQVAAFYFGWQWEVIRGFWKREDRRNLTHVLKMSSHAVLTILQGQRMNRRDQLEGYSRLQKNGPKFFQFLYACFFTKWLYCFPQKEVIYFSILLNLGCLCDCFQQEQGIWSCRSSWSSAQKAMQFPLALLLHQTTMLRSMG